MAAFSRSLTLNPVSRAPGGTQSDDILKGTAVADSICGFAGNDKIYGLTGDDTLLGGADNDSLYGGAGNDLLVGGSGNDAIWTGAGFDTVIDGEGADTVYMQGSGVIKVGPHEGDNVFTVTDTNPANQQTLLYNGLIGDFIADLGSYVNAGWSLDGGNTIAFRTVDTVSGFDRLIANGVNGVARVGGTDHSETVIVNGGHLWSIQLAGGGGDDTLKVSYQVADRISLDGGDGNDRLIGGGGGDELNGGSGNDTIIGGEFGDVSGPEFGNPYYNIMSGGDGDDLMIGGNDDSNVRGNYLYGEAGNDTMHGGNQTDFLWGGSGNDWMTSGDGQDCFWFSSGVDRMMGGSGADQFIFTGDAADMPVSTAILDFSSVEGDKIDMRQIDLNPPVFGHEALTFIGTDGFHGAAGEVRYHVWNGNALVEGDVTGDGVADFSLKLLGVTSLSASDFIL